MDYIPIYQIECSLCTTTPVVGIKAPSKVIVCTSLCGPHFFADQIMIDPEEWNRPKEATE